MLFYVDFYGIWCNVKSYNNRNISKHILISFWYRNHEVFAPQRAWRPLRVQAVDYKVVRIWIVNCVFIISENDMNRKILALAKILSIGQILSIEKIPSLEKNLSIGKILLIYKILLLEIILLIEQARNLERCALKAGKLQHGKLKTLHTWLISMRKAECGTSQS